MYRIGQGYDIHRLWSGPALRLGGVTIPSRECCGEVAHSDGDVLLHAIIDALLGSLALGDIGQWFPDNDPAYKDIDSRELLKRVLADARLANWHLVNLDCTIIVQKPKLAPVIPQIRASLASLFAVSEDYISVKAKTNEGLDAVGRGEAIIAQAVILGEIA
jgi:2-C-methyl-D-erythritol 2,4-cyclodiphosphate synthase